MIAEMEQKASSMESAQNTPGGAEHFGPVADLNREIRVLESDVANLQGQIRTYESRVETIPQREQELVAIQRDYDNIRESYQNLLNRKLEAEISLSMERKQKGEQFRVLDFARAPIRPVSPDMRKLFLFFLAAGFASAGGLVVMLEFLDKSFRSPLEIERNLGIPVLATIPILDSNRRKMLRWLNQGMTAVSVLVCMLLLALFTTLILYGVEPTISLLRNLA
jgi:capsular polysaccharide biosynthesis protein